MMAAVAEREIPWPLAELLHRQTEGSPLFVQEMLRYLIEVGLVGEREGALRRVGDDSLAGRILEGLRDVIGKRLTRLGPDANRLLATASVIGREFRIDVLQRVAAMPEDDVITALEEAKAAAIVEERASVGAVVTYRFSHAFFSQTLYEEISAPRRIRLHQQVGRALEEVFARRLDEHAPELAQHFSHSSDPADLTKAVHYGELAAQRAMSVFDYGEAVRILERALDVQEVLDPDDNAKRCDLLLGLAEALMPAGEPLRAAQEIAEEAFAFAETLGDDVRACNACQIAIRGLFAHSATVAFRYPEYRRWANQYDLHAQPNTRSRAGANIALANVALAEGRWADAWTILEGALQIARDFGAAESLFDVAGRLIAPPHLAEHVEARLRLAQELFPQSRQGVSTRTLLSFLSGCLTVFLEWGYRPQAEKVLQELHELVVRTRDTGAQSYDRNWHARFDFLDGRLEAVVALALEQEELSDSGLPALNMRIAVNSLRPRLYLGKTQEALFSIESMDAFRDNRDVILGDWNSGVGNVVLRAICLAYIGRLTKPADW